MVQIGHSLERFCCHQFLNTNNSTLVFSIAPFCFDHCCKPSRHTFNQFLTLLFWNLLPQLLYSVPKFTNTTCRFFKLLQPPVEIIPKVFNGTKVWRLCRPLEDCKVMVFKPFLGPLASVLGVIFLLENNDIH
jgi:hypothetical protein